MSLRQKILALPALELARLEAALATTAIEGNSTAATLLSTLRALRSGSPAHTAAVADLAEILAQKLGTELVAPNQSHHWLASARAFIRLRPDLFTTAQLTLKTRPSGISYTPAEAGLGSLLSGASGSWQGWTRADDDRHGVRKDYGQKTCPHCAKSFAATGATSTYCSPACRSAHYAVHVVGRKTPRDFACEQCHKPTSSIYDEARFCSTKCANIWHSAQRPPGQLKTKPCQHCGQAYAHGATNIGGRLKYCSEACKNAANVARRKARELAARPIRHCITCGTPTGTDPRRKYCEPCAAKAHNRIVRRRHHAERRRIATSQIRKIIDPT